MMKEKKIQEECDKEEKEENIRLMNAYAKLITD